MQDIHKNAPATMAAASSNLGLTPAMLVFPRHAKTIRFFVVHREGPFYAILYGPFMAKQSAAFEIALPARERGTPAYRWLYASLRGEILGGGLRPGTRVPATRDLAKQYGLARGTVVSAFEQLKAEGYLEGTVGSGTRVSRVLPEDLLHVPAENRERTQARPRKKLRFAHYGRRATLFTGYELRRTRAFRCNLPALDLFPISLWAKIANRCLRRATMSLLTGCDPLGYMPLREAVAQYLRSSRAVRCECERVAIVSGVQEALDLVARLFVEPGDRVCMESPGYPGAARVFRAYGATVTGVDGDEEGLLVSDLPASGAKLLYVTPGHQFPLGTTMSLARRLQLLEWSRKSGALIFEDDYDGEYRYTGRPLPALQGLDQNGAVLYAGSFSKVLFPALRLGYLVVPLKLAEKVEAAKSLTTRHAPVLEQMVVREFMSEGHFACHVRRMREVYAERLSVLLEEARSRLAGALDVSSVEAGLQTTGWLARGVKAEAVAERAAERGVEVTPIGRYAVGGHAREGLQLGFAAIDAREIRRGVRELAAVLG
jgi:GntR family transcriptional regulator/MocR family aminotransferase